MGKVPWFVWFALAVFLVCGALEHAMMASILSLDLSYRLSNPTSFR